MKASELREKTVEELKSELTDNLRLQFSLRMQRGSGQLSQSHLFKQARREIARINTVLKEKQGE